MAGNDGGHYAIDSINSGIFFCVGRPDGEVCILPLILTRALKFILSAKFDEKSEAKMPLRWY